MPTCARRSRWRRNESLHFFVAINWHRVLYGRRQEKMSPQHQPRHRDSKKSHDYKPFRLHSLTNWRRSLQVDADIDSKMPESVREISQTAPNTGAIFNSHFSWMTLVRYVSKHKPSSAAPSARSPAKHAQRSPVVPGRRAIRSRSRFRPLRAAVPPARVEKLAASHLSLEKYFQ